MARPVDAEVLSTTAHPAPQTSPTPAVSSAPALGPAARSNTAPGRRRATKHEGARGPLFRGVPSAPVLLGVATLALAVGGAVVSGTPALAGHSTSDAAGADAAHRATTASASQALAAPAARGPVLNRGGSRDTFSENTGDDISASAADVRQHDAAVDQLTQQAQKQSDELNRNRWVLPIEPGVYHLTARFGDTGLWATFHTGLDFACSTGTPIHAIASGTVTFAGYDGAYGNKTVVTLPDGTEIWYGHQTTQYVQVGDKVTRGDVIGTVGSTGHVTGPHVHIEVRPDGGDPIDPYPQFVEHGVTP